MSGRQTADDGRQATNSSPSVVGRQSSRPSNPKYKIQNTKSRPDDTRTAALFLLPNFLGFLIFTAGPVLFTLVISFSNWELSRTVPFQWTGLYNYIKLFSDREFWYDLLNTFYLMLGIPFAIAGSLALAILLSQRLRGMVVYRTLFYLPSFTSGVALFVLWKALYNPDFGPIDAFLDWILNHLHLNSLFQTVFGTRLSPPEWLQSTHNLVGLDVEQARLTRGQLGLGARDAIVIMGIWLAIGGNNMLLYLAGISNIPQELYEAAQLDGAGKWNSFRHITWPQLAPTTFFIVVMSFIGGIQGGFEHARVMTLGGPAGTTTTLVYHIYTKAFEEAQIGYAAAVSWVLFAIIFAVTLVNWRFSSRETGD
jgi:ABC-type sugar transport systems, permease components